MNNAVELFRMIMEARKALAGWQNVYENAPFVDLMSSTPDMVHELEILIHTANQMKSRLGK